MKANCEKKLPQVGTGCTTAGESHTGPSPVCPSYSGGGNNRLTASIDVKSQGGSPARSVESLAEVNTSASQAPKSGSGDAGSESNSASAITGAHSISSEREEVGGARSSGSVRDRPEQEISMTSSSNRPADVNDEAECLQEAKPDICDAAVMPQACPSGARPQKKWWSQEIASLRQASVAARRRYTRHRRLRIRPPDAETKEAALYADYKVAKTALKEAILKAKELAG